MMKELEKMCNRDLVKTENGALGYKSTSHEILDLNFKIPSMRNGLSKDDIDKFITALKTNFEYAVKWMFFVRDFRGNGIGERDTFRNLYKIFYEQYPVEASELISLISEYGRWDDVIELAFSGNKELQTTCFKVIEKQLKEDVLDCTNNKPISLLAKWLPSINASKRSRGFAIQLSSFLGMCYGAYRKMLSKLRAYLDVTECKTCGNKWSEIEYNKVSSNANLRYSNSFLKHDETRRREYLAELAKPNSSVKMNASVLTPCEIWHKYTKGNYYDFVSKDDALESMWNNLKDMGDCGKTLTVVDGSGSMTVCIPNSSIQAIDVSRSLGVYFAERCTGEFHNKMIEFSSRPRFIDLDGKESLVDKINHMSKFNDCSNTNIEAVFDLILKTAVNHHMKQEDMPDRILIVSDMEFDYAIRNDHFTTLFEHIAMKYSKEGYKMPRLVFWNVNSRTNTIPVTENEAGVALISGYSVNLLKMVMSNETDPWLILKETLDSERYEPITNTLNSLKNE